MAARGGVAEALEGLIEGLGGVVDVLVLPAAAPEGLSCDRPLGRLGYSDGFLAAASPLNSHAVHSVTGTCGLHQAGIKYNVTAIMTCTVCYCRAQLQGVKLLLPRW